MGKILLFILVAIIAGIISIAKNATGKVISNENLKNSSFKNETKKVMDKTAKGINWMDKQWEDAKQQIDDDYKK